MDINAAGNIVKHALEIIQPRIHIDFLKFQYTKTKEPRSCMDWLKKLGHKETLIRSNTNTNKTA